VPSGPSPSIAVCVASHARPLRLRWLLNALEEQTLERSAFEVVVAHDSGPGSETERLLAAHPLAASGVLRHLTFTGDRGPAELRNAAWRAAHAPVVAFTDDDCRPPAGWVERALGAARADAVVQGHDPAGPRRGAAAARAARAHAAHRPAVRNQAQTCNIVYPRALLERLGGFDERACRCAPARTPTSRGARRRRAWRSSPRPRS
jgi:glycosyltransferase involved in cell wall biosynthesis